MPKLILVLHEIRSAQNVGAILRSAACFGVKEVVMSGITPYPQIDSDVRLPHQIAKTQRAIAKTALGAEELVVSSHIDGLPTYIEQMRNKGFLIIALEQAPTSQQLQKIDISDKTLLIVGNEVSGVEPAILEKADVVAEIPMLGKKESLNVAVATGIALFHLTK